MTTIETPVEPGTPPATIPAILRDKVGQLAYVRRAAAATDAQLRAARLAFEAAHADLIARARTLGEDALTLELDIKAGAAKHYRATGDAHPCAGVGIRVGTAYDIHAEAAWAWIREHKMEDTLTKPAALDEKAITKLASVSALPFVAAIQKVTPTIATDLDRALGAAEAA